MREPQCDHLYMFLRQEIRDIVIGFDAVQLNRPFERAVEDVFFCQRCLEYDRVEVRREVRAATVGSIWSVA